MLGRTDDLNKVETGCGVNDNDWIAQPCNARFCAKDMAVLEELTISDKIHALSQTRKDYSDPLVCAIHTGYKFFSPRSWIKAWHFLKRLLNPL